jgi:hypothetical protein
VSTQASRWSVAPDPATKLSRVLDHNGELLELEDSMEGCMYRHREFRYNNKIKQGKRERER